MNKNLSATDTIILNAVFAKVDKTAFALASGLVFFLIMFTLTAILIFKGATPTHYIGPNMQSLNLYLPGYDITWIGNIIGSIYAGIIGAVFAAVFAILWNLVHYLYLAFVVHKLQLYDDI